MAIFHINLVMITLLTSTFLFLTTIQNSVYPIVAPSSDSTCKRGKDTLTGRIVYLTADTDPECEGGRRMLLRRLNKSINFPKSALAGEIQTTFIVGFIVEANGQITGERVMRDNTNQIGKQILKVIKSCHWYPARCNGKKVDMLYTFPINIDPQTD